MRARARVCVRACVCACVCVRACARVCVCVCVRVFFKKWVELSKEVEVKANAVMMNSERKNINKLIQTAKQHKMGVTVQQPEQGGGRAFGGHTCTQRTMASSRDVLVSLATLAQLRRSACT